MNGREKAETRLCLQFEKKDRERERDARGKLKENVTKMMKS